MQFKHPEILYALFLLLIPILIHLFQLRRFQKVAFTNVAFLKKVSIQTRKSSQLKKWLTLLMRLLALTCIIIAFAQPFTASDTALNSDKEIVLYLDNSFSMQAKGANGPLKQRAVQEIFEQHPGSEKISWFTNDFSRKNSSMQSFKNELLAVDYTSKQLTAEEVLLKANQLFTKKPDSDKRLIYISDFQQQGAFPKPLDNVTVDVVQLKAATLHNVAIDSVYITSKTPENITLEVLVSALGESPQNTPLSLFNDETLIAKTGADLSENSQSKLSFSITANDAFNGKLELSDAGLPYDNTLYFNLNTPKKIKVLSINQANSGFIQRLFDQPEFEYSQQSFSNLNYNDIPEQNFVILNELQDIPASLTTALASFSSNGGSILLIPSETAKLNDYNTFLTQMRMGSFSEKAEQEKQITQIVFDHPLYDNVFEKQVVNFQYPKVNSYFQLNSNATPVLRFEDSKPFIVQQGNTYVGTAPFNSENSNFQNSPLIVPTLYNMALLSLSLPRLYYAIGAQNTFAVPVSLKQDEILTMKDSTTRFIPLQQTKANKVTITTTDEPAKAGIYSIEKEEDYLQSVSYNYNRDESNLQFADASDWEGVSLYSNIPDLFDAITEINTINSFWKWFAIFALLFLIFEMLILKYYK
ncbi:BatA domain-containing protein [Constantimarinum furrinae]|uniref:N-terminal double-transmembrane domain-containing protein n=1 Tax=Constantimarinum furrinae TaxID=2562285 RepID=A0A7G8PWB9_9FLAO|nr:BatA domain-containing protein [Constantimarinum furrinae]QNJ98635.1 N-terminal double-transmembrane domain-containing protein [Constantimarinum furrinae]